MTSTIARVSSTDGTELLVRAWAPATAPWASVLLVHGIAEHSGRYEHVGERLAAAGLDVEAYDQRGFGASGGRRAYVDRWEQQHDDLEARLRAVRDRAARAGTPIAIYAHSLGGLIALGYVLTDRPKPDLLVLSAPALTADLPVWKLAMARVLGRVAPGTMIKNALDGATLSRDPSVAERYLADPLNQHATTARFGAAAIAEQGRVRAGLAGLTLPTLVIHGGDDRLVPTASSEPLAAVPGVTRRVYPGLRHELHNEPDGPAVIDDVVDWLRSQISGSGAPVIDFPHN